MYRINVDTIATNAARMKNYNTKCVTVYKLCNVRINNF